MEWFLLRLELRFKYGAYNIDNYNIIITNNAPIKQLNIRKNLFLRACLETIKLPSV